MTVFLASNYYGWYMLVSKQITETQHTCWESSRHPSQTEWEKSQSCHRETSSLSEQHVVETGLDSEEKLHEGVKMA